MGPLTDDTSRITTANVTPIVSTGTPLDFRCSQLCQHCPEIDAGLAVAANIGRARGHIRTGNRQWSSGWRDTRRQDRIDHVDLSRSRVMLIMSRACRMACRFAS